MHNTVLSIATRIGIDVQVHDLANGAAIEFGMEAPSQKSGDYSTFASLGFMRFEMLPVGHVVTSHMNCL